jgi:hypothetical protein
MQLAKHCKIATNFHPLQNVRLSYHLVKWLVVVLCCDVTSGLIAPIMEQQSHSHRVQQPVCAAAAADDATCFLEEVSINKRVQSINIMKKSTYHI